MSFDLGVWSCSPAIAERRAHQIYERLCRGEHPSEISASPAVVAFYAELIEKWPEGNDDASPWSSRLNHSADHVLMACKWEKAEEVYMFAQDLAERHGLVLYDPQSDEVHAPE